MNVIDHIQADVFTACNSDLHGRAGNYRIANTIVDIPMNVVVPPDKWKSVFDTGGSEIDFNIITAYVGANELTVAPLEQGRGTAGDTFVFTDFPSKTWHVRSLGTSAEYAGNYYDIVLADYTGPINGV